MNVAVALFLYNRFEHSESALDQLLKYSNHKVYIFMDGPRTSLDALTQQKILDSISVFKSHYPYDLTVIHSDINRGLATSLRCGIDYITRYHDGVIILEDDIQISNLFFPFMESCLANFKHDENISSVCGFQYPVVHQILGTSSQTQLVELKRFCPWGWATWPDQWLHYYQVERALQTVNSHFLRESGIPKDLLNIFNSYKGSKIQSDTWSIPWTLSNYINNKSVLFPSRSLVCNTGFDGTGTHCSTTQLFDINLHELPLSSLSYDFLDAHKTKQVEDSINCFLADQSLSLYEIGTHNCLSPSQLVEPP